MLEAVPGKSRRAFFFGHYRGYGITKDGCLKIRDLEKSPYRAQVSAVVPRNVEPDT